MRRCASRSCCDWRSPASSSRRCSASCALQQPGQRVQLAGLVGALREQPLQQLQCARVVGRRAHLLQRQRQLQLLQRRRRRAAPAARSRAPVRPPARRAPGRHRPERRQRVARAHGSGAAGSRPAPAGPAAPRGPARPVSSGGGAASVRCGGWGAARCQRCRRAQGKDAAPQRAGQVVRHGAIRSGSGRRAGRRPAVRCGRHGPQCIR